MSIHFFLDAFINHFTHKKRQVVPQTKSCDLFQYQETKFYLRKKGNTN